MHIMLAANWLHDQYFMAVKLKRVAKGGGGPSRITHHANFLSEITHHEENFYPITRHVNKWYFFKTNQRIYVLTLTSIYMFNVFRRIAR